MWLVGGGEGGSSGYRLLEVGKDEESAGLQGCLSFPPVIHHANATASQMGSTHGPPRHQLIW